jgi:hypothetical protein|tara:strand:- start:987 stop:1259 length:273 start_codon:yes stop_codon:yes gene_type:complete
MYIREKSYLEKMLFEISFNTNSNLHSENGMLLAINFGTETQKEEMFEILEKHKDNESLTSISSTARKYLVKDILQYMDDKNLASHIRDIL